MALVPDLIKFDEPPKVPILLEAPIPEEAARAQEYYKDLNAGIDKKVIEGLNPIFNRVEYRHRSTRKQKHMMRTSYNIKGRQAKRELM